MKHMLKGALIALAICNFAQAEDEKPEIKTPPMLSALEEEGGTIHDRWKINEHLNGFSLTIGMDQLIVYATADGEYILNGSLLDKSADDLTPEFSKKYLPEPSFEGVVQKLEASKWIGTHNQKAPRQLYVIHDPNCPFCKKAHESIMEHQYTAKAGVRWIPVAALGQSSLEMAAALLKSKEPMKLQDDFNKGYHPSEAEITAAKKNMQDVMDNTKLMKLLRISGTPAVVVVEDGTVKKIITGFQRGDILTALGV